MLDINFESILKVDAVLQKPSKDCDAIVLTRCTIFKSEDEPYSEVNEGSFCTLNSNNGFGDMNIEMEFANAEKYFYKDYYINCVAIRINGEIIYKPIGMKAQKQYSKITKNGNFAIGLRYFFTSEEEINKILNNDQFIVEFAMAIDDPKNTYQVMCSFVKTKKGWKIKHGNTYQMDKGKHINNFIH